MDWVEHLPRPDWITVGIAAVCTLIASVFSAVLAAKTATTRLMRDYRLEDKTDAVLLKLLQSPKYDFRTLEHIKVRVPLADEKLVEALIRIGAVHFTSYKHKEGVWGLLENHEKIVFGPKSDDPIP